MVGSLKEKLRLKLKLKLKREESQNVLLLFSSVEAALLLYPGRFSTGYSDVCSMKAGLAMDG